MSEARRQRGAAARKAGRKAEWTAALWLMLRGYRILGFRLKTRQGEIDLLAMKKGVLAVVEVKRRGTLEAALECVGAEQRERLRRAGQGLASRRPGLKDLAVRLDLVALAPGRVPVHIMDAWQDDVSGP
ncbi:MAG: YraN family protein [Alphaproteobacteria bacterium]